MSLYYGRSESPKPQSIKPWSKPSPYSNLYPLYVLNPTNLLRNHYQPTEQPTNPINQPTNHPPTQPPNHPPTHPTTQPTTHPPTQPPKNSRVFPNSFFCLYEALCNHKHAINIYNFFILKFAMTLQIHHFIAASTFTSMQQKWIKFYYN